ncbi:DUF2232 domain-containing protein [Tepidimicrobium xylanilyticum]
MKIDYKRKIVEFIFTITTSLILMFMGTYYFTGFMFLYPLPFILLGFKYDINHALLALILSAVSTGLMLDMVSGILIFVMFAPLCLSLIYTMKSRRDSLTILFINTLIFLFSILLMISISKNMTGISIIGQLSDISNQTINYWIDVLKDIGSSNYEILKAREFLEERFEYLILTVPALTMIFSLIIAYLNFLLATLLLSRLGYGVVSIPRFSKFKLPNNFLLGTGLMFLGAFIIKKLEIFYYETIFINLTAIVSFLFLTQGLAVIDYKLKIKNVKIILRLLIYVFLILPIIGIMPFIGVLDIIFDFRGLRKYS